MGWWQVTTDGNKTAGATGMIWGDEAADIMNNAVDLIREAYEREWNRQPSLEELAAGLRFSLAGQDLT